MRRPLTDAQRETVRRRESQRDRRAETEQREAAETLLLQTLDFKSGHAYEILFAVYFWARVDIGATDACWHWMAGKRPRDYGNVCHHSTDRSTHRVAYALTFGRFDDGLDVLHSCDNPPCCNPRHLSLGTHVDNMRDVAARDRSPHKIERVLSPEIARHIAAFRERGESAHDVAREFGIGWRTAYALAHRYGFRFQRLMKVPPEVEQQIADLRGSGVGANDLARRFHLHRGTVWACVQRARARADMGGVA